MDSATLIGLFIGTFFIVTGIGVSQLGVFIDIPSVLIVVGGTVATTFCNFSLEAIKGSGKVWKKLFVEAKTNPLEIIASLVSFAEKARREGLLALEDDVEKLDDEFLKKGIQLVVDGTDPELVKRILETEMGYLSERHTTGQEILISMGAYAPAFGMIGTLIGLILMLGKLDDPSSIGPAMATALITTMYGAVMANFIFLPMSGKLKQKSKAEIMIKEIMVEGLLSIQAGDNPRIVEEKLKAFLPPSMRAAKKEVETGEEAAEE
ncbi:MAG: MotA/TolQ/ExbB proton channel family protein [Candidatus Wallbacteria bacterium]|nr:MotA/TolQ/ExbB proton channel family protein [Candidatus Wallbacteria bacterium]